MKTIFDPVEVPLWLEDAVFDLLCRPRRRYWSMHDLFAHGLHRLRLEVPERQYDAIEAKMRELLTRFRDQQRALQHCALLTGDAP